jgi:urease alpha subunit
MATTISHRERWTGAVDVLMVCHHLDASIPGTYLAFAEAASAKNKLPPVLRPGFAISMMGKRQPGHGPRGILRT